MGRAIWVALVSMGLILLASLYADGARRNIGYQLMARRQQVLEYAQNGNGEMASRRFHCYCHCAMNWRLQ